MIAIKPITKENVSHFKDVRLRALQEAPYAFGSTYAAESRFPDAEWLARVERWSGGQGAGFLAMDGDVACGIAGTFLDQHDVSFAQLIAMWTAPSHRQKGVGRLLVTEILHWARRRNASTLRLMVTSVNDGAIRFYERLGFTRTGRTEQYPNDPGILEYEMSRPIQ